MKQQSTDSSDRIKPRNTRNYTENRSDISSMKFRVFRGHSLLDRPALPLIVDQLPEFFFAVGGETALFQRSRVCRFISFSTQ